MSDVGSNAGERDLGTLLGSMRPALHEPVYLFATLPFGHELPRRCGPSCNSQKSEDLTVVVEREALLGQD